LEPAGAAARAAGRLGLRLAALEVSFGHDVAIRVDAEKMLAERQDRPRFHCGNSRAIHGMASVFKLADERAAVVRQARVHDLRADLHPHDHTNRSVALQHQQIVIATDAAVKRRNLPHGQHAVRRVIDQDQETRPEGFVVIGKPRDGTVGLEFAHYWRLLMKTVARL